MKILPMQLQQYAIQDARTGERYTVVAPTVEDACLQAGVPLDYALLVASPIPPKVYLLRLWDSNTPEEVQLAYSPEQACAQSRLGSETGDYPVCEYAFDSLKACYLWVLGRLCAASYTPEAGAWIRLLQQVHQLAYPQPEFEG